MSWASVRLEFLRGFITRSAIAAETGLTSALQNDILSGVYNPTGLTKGYLDNLYKRTAYQEMKNVGFSANQANRFRSYSPETVLSRMETVKGLIDELAKGALDLKLEKAKITLSGQAYTDAYDDMYDTVKEGFSYSTKEYEEWQDYGRV